MLIRYSPVAFHVPTDQVFRVFTIDLAIGPFEGNLSFALLPDACLDLAGGDKWARFIFLVVGSIPAQFDRPDGIGLSFASYQKQ